MEICKYNNRMIIFKRLITGIRNNINQILYKKDRISIRINMIIIQRSNKYKPSKSMLIMLIKRAILILSMIKIHEVCLFRRSWEQNILMIK